MNSNLSLGRSLLVGTFITSIVLACSSSNETEQLGEVSQAITGTGGAKATGGSKATGGKSSTGGSKATGGKSSTGGTTSTGGSKATGGKSSTGSKATGGKSSTGGTTSTGGSKATGGKSSTGGTTSTGGSKATGGKSSTGGTTSTGGTKATGGVTSTGGFRTTGGTNATGGSTTIPVCSPPDCNDNNPCTTDLCSAGTCTHTPVTTDPTCAQADLQVRVLTNYFDTAQAQQFLQVTNLGATPANLSSISIKLWVDDTGNSSVVPSISTGGCVTDTPSSQNCIRQMTGVVGTATHLASVCGPDTNHAGNWEIKISNTDGTVLAPGQTWNNIQVQLHLASWGTFVPGTSYWYSPCLSGTGYVEDHHFAVYYADVASNKADACPEYLCGGTLCTASDACHIAGTCTPATGLCSNPVGPNGTPCNDGSVCTQTDQCIAGLCSGANPVTCTASDVCHVAGTCDPLAGCTNPAAPDGTACNDGSACTVGDLCQSGSCQPGSPVPVDDLNPCTTDACDPVTGVMHTPAAGTCCSDGNACNGNETCNASGTCQAGAAVTCEAGPCYPGGSCSLTLTTPAAYPADNIVLGASDSIDIGSFATVSGPSAGIVALGCSGVQLGMTALATTSVWSGGGVMLDYNAKVDGNVEAGSQPALYPGATITGNSVVRSGLPSLNNQRIDLTFGNCVNDVILESNQVRPIKPGQYRTVSVKANTKLQLGQGHYWFDSLSVESGGTIEVNAPSDNPNAPPGSLTIVVRGSATLGGSTTFPLGTIDFKLLVGGSDVVLSAPFSGTIIAPNAHIAFNSTAAAYQGSFEGKTIKIAPGVTVNYVAPVNMDELPYKAPDGSSNDLGIPTTAGAPPVLNDPSLTPSQIASSFINWTKNSTGSDQDAWRSSIVTMRSNAALVQAVVDSTWAAVNSLDVMTGVIGLNILAGLRMSASETVFETLVAQAPPGDGPLDETGTPDKTRMFETLQVHAVRGLGWLWLKSPSNTTLRQVALSHPRPVVQQEAIRVYILYGGAAAKADLAAALPADLQIYLDRPESINFENSTFDSRLTTYLTKHPELLPPAQPPIPNRDPSQVCDMNVEE